MINQKSLKVSWISGMPRSGSTWLSQIFASSPDVRLKFCPLFSYNFKNSLNEYSSSEDWKNFFLKVYETNSEFLDQQHLRKIGLIPFFKKKKEKPTNLIIKSNRFHNLTPYILELYVNCKFIHIIRDPSLSVYSWIKNPHEFPSDSNPLLNWRTGKCRKTGPGEFWGFEDWQKVSLQAIQLSKRYPHRHKIIRYETLLSDTEKYAMELFEFLQINFTKHNKNFIKKSHSHHDSHQNSVYKDPKLINQSDSFLYQEIKSFCASELKGTDLEQFII